MASSVKPLDVWVDNLFDTVFFQPDDELAMRTYEDSISPEIHVEVNGQVVPVAAYRAAVTGYRKANVGKNLSNPTLSMVVDNAEKQTGVVAQCGKFSSVDKTSGKEVLATAVTICKVAEVDGKRMLISLTEVQPDD